MAFQAGSGERAFPTRVLLSETQLYGQIDGKIRGDFRKRILGDVSLVPREVDMVCIPSNHQLPQRRSFAGGIVDVFYRRYLWRLKILWRFAEFEEFIYDIVS